MFFPYLMVNNPMETPNFNQLSSAPARGCRGPAKIRWWTHVFFRFTQCSGLVDKDFWDYMGMGQNLAALVNIIIAGKWMFIPLKMVFIGIDP
jgi:hypothetical protein